MKRILIFSLAYTPYVGGAEIAIKETTTRLGFAEYRGEYLFDMITLRFDRNLPKVERIGNVTIHRIGFIEDCRAYRIARSRSISKSPKSCFRSRHSSKHFRSTIIIRTT